MALLSDCWLTSSAHTGKPHSRYVVAPGGAAAPIRLGAPFARVLQAYQSTPSESTGFTPHRVVFGREMHLPIDIGTPLPESPRDIRTFANSLVEDLEWFYHAAHETTGLHHRRSEAR